jgi:ABC-type glycerol-3-phosphate transport system substrate-binding protein
MKTEKYFTVLLIFLFAFGVGCTNKVVENQNEGLKKVDQKTTINFIGHWLNEGKREELVRNFAREYEFENQQIAVNLKFPEEVYFDQLDRGTNEKFIAQVISEETPKWDVIKVNGAYDEMKNILKDPDWAKKYLVDFSEIEEFRNGTPPELLNDEAKKYWNGIIPGPYLEGQFWTLWFNKKLADKLGIQIKQYGMTVDDFTGYLKAVYDYNQKHPEQYIMPIYESYVWRMTVFIVFQMYASLLTDHEEFFCGTVTEHRLKAWEKTLEALEVMSKYKPLNRDWRKTEWGKTQACLPNQECLFLANGSWMYNIWQNIDPVKTLDCVPAEFPSFGGDFAVYPWAYITTWAVLKKSPHKDEAIKFLLAMNKPAMADTWVRYTKCPTGIKGSLTGVTFGSDQFESFAYYIQDKYKNKRYNYNPSGKLVLDERFQQVNPLFFTEVLEGEMTAKEAMKKIRQLVGH